MGQVEVNDWSDIFEPQDRLWAVSGEHWSCCFGGGLTAAAFVKTVTSKCWLSLQATQIEAT
jgi:hypothetical protein